VSRIDAITAAAAVGFLFRGVGEEIARKTVNVLGFAFGTSWGSGGIDPMVGAVTLTLVVFVTIRALSKG